jgi:PPOX class probable F420-dependent enzyme
MLTAEQEAFVRGPHIAVLATVGEDGEPRAYPMWYAHEGGRFLMTTRRGTQKHRHLEAHPRASIVIDHRSRPYYALMIACTAEVVRDEVDLIRSRIASRYLKEPELTTYLESRRGTDAVGIAFSVTSVATYGDSPPTRSG